MSDVVIQTQELSKWYGEVLGVNRVSLDIPSGITSLVGPNGCGKSTLMNLMAGLLLPSRGSVEVLGIPTHQPEQLHRVLGYCTSHDRFHDRLTGEEFLLALLRTHGHGSSETSAMVDRSLERVDLAHARHKKIGAYSKGMRQRLKLALAIAHEPRVLILDEPLNGLDPQGRCEVIDLLRDLASASATVLISSHILHEVDLVSDKVIMLHHGYVMAEGGISEVRSEIQDRPFQVRVRCDEPARLAARAFAGSGVVSGRIEADSLLVETTDTQGFAKLITELAIADELEIETIEMADENVQAVYDYLIGPGGEAT